MIISQVTNSAAAPSRRRLIAANEEGRSSALIGVAPLPAAPTPALSVAPPTTAAPGHLKQILAAGAAAKGADSAVTLLLEQVNRATPAQLGSFMMDYHLAVTPAAAQSQAEQMLKAIHNKEGGSVLLGVRAGVVTYAVVETLAPRWSFAWKLGVSLAVALAAAAAVYFGVPDPSTKPVPAKTIPSAARD